MSIVPSRGSDQFVLRLPDGMRARIAAAARRDGRSMNAEIVSALVRAFPPPIAESADVEACLLEAARRALPLMPVVDVPAAAPAPIQQAIEEHNQRTDAVRDLLRAAIAKAEGRS